MTEYICPTSAKGSSANFAGGSNELSQPEVGQMTEAEDALPAPEPPEMVEVTVSLPANLLADYDREVSTGYYASREEALRQGLLESWRHHRGSYSTIRVDLRDPSDKRPDTRTADEPETRESDAGGADEAAQD